MRKQPKRRSSALDSKSLASCRRWSVHDAQLQFKEIVQNALDGRPQCVTKEGKDAAVVISYEMLAKFERPIQNLYEFFRQSPLVDSDIDLTRLSSGLRETEL